MKMSVCDAESYFGSSLVPKSMRSQISHMFRALGVVLVLWYLSHTFTQSFVALDQALTAMFETLEAAAVASRVELK